MTLPAVVPTRPITVGAYDCTDDQPWWNVSTAESDDFCAGAEDYEAVVPIGSIDELIIRLEDIRNRGFDIGEVHLFCHGAPGEFTVGRDVVDRSILNSRGSREQLRRLGEASGKNSLICLHSCETFDRRRFANEFCEAVGVRVRGYTGSCYFWPWVYHTGKEINLRPLPPPPPPPPQQTPVEIEDSGPKLNSNGGNCCPGP
jgi:hypothetical protein